MPVPGPRVQTGALSGYRNPDGEQPTRFNRWGRPVPVASMGNTPGLMYVTLRGCVLGAGQIRRMWRQAIGFIPGPPAYSQSISATYPSEFKEHDAIGITRALRYRTLSISPRAGEDSTRFSGLHTKIRPKVRSKPVHLGAGLVRSRPTVRNRLSSFGSRVPTINQQSNAAQGNDAPQ